MTAPRSPLLTDEEIEGHARFFLGMMGVYSYTQGSQEARSIYETEITKLLDRIARQAECLKEFERAIGEHSAPSDCYATGPMTGDSFRDLIQCPACSALGMYHDLVAVPIPLPEKGGE